MPESRRPHSVIVVGAGAAGAALAARLSEDAARTVTVLEAGPAALTVEDLPAELALSGAVEGARPGHDANWSWPAFLTATRPYTIARGKIAGGSTSINGSYFVRARRADAERWSERGATEWRFERLLSIYRRLENDHDFGITSVHGGTGPMFVERPPQNSPVAVAFSAAAASLGYPFEPDKNDQGAAGYGPLPLNTHDSLRWNTALAYLAPAQARPNLTVRGDTRVLRILFRDGREPRAVGVQVLRGDGRREQLYADEIVLAAGSVSTPHLLLLSGVGPQRELEDLGLRVVSDRPGVGRGFSDHPQLSVDWQPKDGVVDMTTRQSLAVALNFGSPDASPGQSDLEILPFLKPTAFMLSGQQSSDPLSLLVSLQGETSRGSLRLVSADPLQPPLIEYHYLETADDRSRLRAGVRAAVALLHTPSFAALTQGVAGPADSALRAAIDTDDALDEWMLATLGTAIHLCGTAPLGPAHDPAAVVDQYGRVHGVTGLRLADTSILPDAPSRGPAATAVLIGELISDFLRRGD